MRRLAPWGGRRRTACQEDRPGPDIESGVFPQAVVEDYDPQSVQELPLIFMDTLDVAIENAVRIDGYLGAPPQPIGKLAFGAPLGLSKRIREAGIRGERLKFAQLGEVFDPLLPDGFGNRARERRVRQMQPAARRDPVGLVVKPLGEHL